MNTSEKTVEISKALVKAQKSIKSAVRESTNPFYKSSYADLTSVLDACRDAMNDNGVVILQPVLDGKVQTYLIHETGEFLMTEMPIVVSRPNDPQAMGSAITYARRYALQSFLCMGAEDDDAEKAKPVAPVQTTQPVRPSQTQPSTYGARPTV